MDVKWDYQLKQDQRSNPVIYKTLVDLDENFMKITREMVDNIFLYTKSQSLKTWGYSERSKDDPHFIGVKGSTTLHTDPRYSRYTHQLKIYVDGDFYTWGLNKEKTYLKRGLFYILDTHSPHQVVSESKDTYNISISMDKNDIIHPNEALNIIMNWGMKADFMDTTRSGVGAVGGKKIQKL